MTTVTSSEAQALLPRLLARVAQGEEVFITDGGLPVARLSQLTAQEAASLTPPSQARTSNTQGNEDEDEERPWRGVFAIESPGEPYPDAKLPLSATPQLPEPQTADIFWDRMNRTDELLVD